MFGLDVDVQDAVIVQFQNEEIAVVVVLAEIDAPVRIGVHCHGVGIGGVPVVVVLGVGAKDRWQNFVAEGVAQAAAGWRIQAQVVGAGAPARKDDAVQRGSAVHPAGEVETGDLTHVLIIQREGNPGGGSIVAHAGADLQLPHLGQGQREVVHTVVRGAAGAGGTAHGASFRHGVVLVPGVVGFRFRLRPRTQRYGQGEGVCKESSVGFHGA